MEMHLEKKNLKDLLGLCSMTRTAEIMGKHTENLTVMLLLDRTWTEW